MKNNTVTILGARGSVSVSGAAFSRYGGATTCVLVCLGGETVVLDAGTGLLHLPEELLSLPELPLLLSHPHVDHLIGLPMCAYALHPGAHLALYAASRGGLDARAQVERLLSPPLWPVGPEALPGRISWHELPAALRFGPLRVDTMEGVHPGGVTLLRLTGGGKRVVFATDCTLTEALLPDLRAFAADCDLLLCDGQYSDGEWCASAAFGHSRWTDAARLARDCGAKQARILHHDPRHTDDMLDAAEAEAARICPQCRFAREGEVICL